MKNLLIICSLAIFSFAAQAQKDLKVGAEQTSEYLALLKDKKVGLVANHTTIINHVHLLDTLLSMEINVVKIFCPEHGFRGESEAGALITSSKDSKTGLPIISLYGKNKKPKGTDFNELDIIIFDIQDVGARVYTYISTLHYVMETAAETNIPLLVFDRPNPNGFYVDGPVLDTNFHSFVGMHPVPIVHGLTIGEYAQMINGENWLQNQLQCNLTVIPIKNYSHKTLYEIPIPPSPNLQNMNAIYLYPSICWFEGTRVSVGRGTLTPFEIIGSPDYTKKNFSFTPKPVKGVSENPPFKSRTCYGMNLKGKGNEILKEKQIDLSYLIEMYNSSSQKDSFFQPFFDKLSGTKELKSQIRKGVSEKEIRKSWQSGLEAYKIQRKKYLLYEDFE